MNEDNAPDIEDTLIRVEYEERIGRKLTDEEVSAFRLVGNLKHEAERDFGVYVHFHKGGLEIECSTGTVFEYPDFDNGMNNWVNDEYHLADIVYRALRLERVGLAEIRDFIRNQIKKGTNQNG